MKRQRKISFRYFAVCLTVCVSLLLTACGKDSAAGGDGEAGSGEAERQVTGGSESGDKTVQRLAAAERVSADHEKSECLWQ